MNPRIYLLRHAQSRWQASPGDDLDSALTDLGHQQATRTAAWLAGAGELLHDGPGCLYTSPLRRARQTARHLADATGLPLRTLEGLKEADFHLASELAEAHDPRSMPVGSPSARYAGYRDRVRETLGILLDAADADRGRVFAVTHGGFVKTLLRVIAGSDLFCATLHNTSLNGIEWRRGRWHIMHVNMTAHLPPELKTS